MALAASPLALKYDPDDHASRQSAGRSHRLTGAYARACGDGCTVGVCSQRCFERTARSLRQELGPAAQIGGYGPIAVNGSTDRCGLPIEKPQKPTSRRLPHGPQANKATNRRYGAAVRNTSSASPSAARAPLSQAPRPLKRRRRFLEAFAHFAARCEGRGPAPRHGSHAAVDHDVLTIDEA
jgi:hypothetical protein